MRLIDADALLALIQDEYIFYKEQYETTEIEEDKAILVAMAGKLLWSKNTVRKAPTIDAVEVVRCKDCKEWNYEYDDVGLCTVDVPDIDGVQRKACDYCSNGERRETT